MNTVRKTNVKMNILNVPCDIVSDTIMVFQVEDQVLCLLKSHVSYLFWPAFVKKHANKFKKWEVKILGKF